MLSQVSADYFEFGIRIAELKKEESLILILYSDIFVRISKVEKMS